MDKMDTHLLRLFCKPNIFAIAPFMKRIPIGSSANRKSKHNDHNHHKSFTGNPAGPNGSLVAFIFNHGHWHVFVPPAGWVYALECLTIVIESLVQEDRKCRRLLACQGWIACVLFVKIPTLFENLQLPIGAGIGTGKCTDPLHLDLKGKCFIAVALKTAPVGQTHLFTTTAR